jgi:hypothetical protein
VTTQKHVSSKAALDDDNDDDNNNNNRNLAVKELATFHPVAASFVRKSV